MRVAAPVLLDYVYLDLTHLPAAQIEEKLPTSLSSPGRTSESTR